MSIRRELLVSLLGAVLIAGLLAALTVYYQARNEFGELLDYQLRQMALAVRDDAATARSGEAPPPYGFDYAIQVMSEDGLRLYYSRSRVRQPPITRSGYDRIETAEGPWRVYTMLNAGSAVQVAQPMGLRDSLAARAAWRTLAPFLLVVPLLAVLVWLSVTRGLRPLDSLAGALGVRTAHSLEPVPDKGLPTEIRPVVASLNDLLLRLSRALSSQRAFVADAAHELRSPLTALKLQLQLAGRAEDETERATALHASREGLDRMTRLVEQLLTLAREDPTRTGDAWQTLDICQIAAEIVGRYAPLADARRIDIGLERRDSDVTLRGDAEGIRTVLSNLVDNALRYTPAGGRVDVRVITIDTAAVIEVSDTGPGIPPEDRERVFDRFYRRAGSDVPGSGLGLAIVRSIASRHGASVTLQDGTEGRGLTVRVVFPTQGERAES